jgi:flagellar biosynthesis protein
VALHYDGEGAPRVTAKGRGAVAEQILALAREHDVPVREDGPLAELLGRVELGDEVPRELYLAVAQVIAFAYQLSGRAPPVPRPGVREVREGPEETGRGPPQGGSDPPE